MAFKSHFSDTLRCFAAIKIKDSNPTTSQKATKANCISPHRTPVISQQKRWWWCFVKWPLKAPLQMLYVIWKMCLSTALFHKKLHNLGFPPLFCLQTDIKQTNKKTWCLGPSMGLPAIEVSRSVTTRPLFEVTPPKCQTWEHGRGGGGLVGCQGWLQVDTVRVRHMLSCATQPQHQNVLLDCFR